MDYVRCFTIQFPGRRTKPWSVDVPCCTACNWSVAYESSHLSNRQSSFFKTKALGTYDMECIIKVMEID